MRTKISFHKQMRINTSKVRLVKCSFSGLRTPVDLDIFFLVSSTKVYYFSRKSLSKYLMDTIDFNKHDIDIFINLVKIVADIAETNHAETITILTATFPMRNCAHMTITKICPL